MVLGDYAPPSLDKSGRLPVKLPLSLFPNISYWTPIEPAKQTLSTDATRVFLRAQRVHSSELNFSLWRGNRLWLMYPIHQMLETFIHRNELYPLFRGLFVDVTDDHSAIVSSIGETLSHFVHGSFETDESGFLEDFYFLTERLMSGEALLTHHGPEMHYEWTDWDKRLHEDPLEGIRREYRQRIE